jgi:hypothetical protein
MTDIECKRERGFTARGNDKNRRLSVFGRRRVMRRCVITVLSAGLLIGLTSCVPNSVLHPEYQAPTATSSGGLPPSVVAGSAEFGWPRTIIAGSVTNIVYAPQVDSWDGHTLLGRSAVAVQTGAQPQPTYGVVTLKAVTLVNKTAGLVSLDNIQITGGDFPSSRTNTSLYVRALREKFPKHLDGLPLDQLESSYVVPPQKLKGPSQALNNTPPKIIVSTKPAILIYIDGPPIARPVPGTDLERIINSHALLLRDKSGEHYLHFLDGYLKAPSLAGPWTVASEPPAGAAEAEKQALVAPVPADLLTAPSDAQNKEAMSLKNTAPPIVYVATSPSELLIFQGEPNFMPIQGTQLLYASNTSGNVFKLLTDQRIYVLLSGRWFASASLDGPWQFVTGKDLPADFANIPDSSPKENVKASVPGTEQATEALINNSIPQSEKVPRNAQMEDPRIDGTPRIEPIAGTSLHYVANSATPIVEVDQNSWYACQNGIWFTSTSVNGPWTVATSVPPVIYTIPPSSPLYYLTYVQVYGEAPDGVYEGYTPGYMGTVVDPYGVVVYGTGYWYPPWVGYYWYGWPYTWGFGWGPCWTPWYSWYFGFGFGWGWGWYGPWGWWHCHPVGPWWGPFPHTLHNGGVVVAQTRNAAGTAARVFPTTGTGSTMASRATPAPLTASSFGRAYNSRTGALVAGQRAPVQNVFDPGNRSPSGVGAWNQRGTAANSGSWRPANQQIPTGAGSSFTGQGRGVAHGYAGPGMYSYPGSAGRYPGWGAYHGGPQGFYHGGGSYGGGAYGGARSGGGGAPSGGGSHGGGGGGGGHGGGGGGGGGGHGGGSGR